MWRRGTSFGCINCSFNCWCWSSGFTKGIVKFHLDLQTKHFSSSKIDRTSELMKSQFTSGYCHFSGGWQIPEPNWCFERLLPISWLKNAVSVKATEKIYKQKARYVYLLITKPSIEECPEFAGVNLENNMLVSAPKFLRAFVSSSGVYLKRKKFWQNLRE